MKSPCCSGPRSSCIKIANPCAILFLVFQGTTDFSKYHLVASPHNRNWVIRVFTKRVSCELSLAFLFKQSEDRFGRYRRKHSPSQEHPWEDSHPGRDPPRHFPNNHCLMVVKVSLKSWVQTLSLHTSPEVLRLLFEERWTKNHNGKYWSSTWRRQVAIWEETDSIVFKDHHASWQ